MKKVVVDASIALKWTVREHDSDAALALLADWSNTEVAVLAPTLLASEVTNILYRRVKNGELPFNEAKSGLEAIIFPAITFDLIHTHTSGFFVRILELASQFKLSAAYDAHYLALAEREQCEFWTADERLYNSVKVQIAWIRLMSNYQPASPSA